MPSARSRSPAPTTLRPDKINPYRSKTVPGVPVDLITSIDQASDGPSPAEISLKIHSWHLLRLPWLHPTPGRVRRGFARLAAIAGTPARPPPRARPAGVPPPGPPPPARRPARRNPPKPDPAAPKAAAAPQHHAT